ncbi:unnamed protein product, partial [Ectocarpus sp. 12 AP-2014]
MLLWSPNETDHRPTTRGRKACARELSGRVSIKAVLSIVPRLLPEECYPAVDNATTAVGRTGGVPALEVPSPSQRRGSGRFCRQQHLTAITGEGRAIAHDSRAVTSCGARVPCPLRARRRHETV